jgi:2'-5' RNA ligase
MRLFTAIDLSAEARAELWRLRGEVAPRADFKRWVPAENYHLTLQFLGEVEADQRAEVEDAMDRESRGAASFELTLGSLGTFPRHGRPRLLWVGLTPPHEALLDLERAMRAAINSLGFPLEDRRYSPHLTLARDLVGAFDPEVRTAQVRPVSWPVKAVHLMQSDLLPGGASYRVVSTFPLAGSRPG